MDDVFELRSDSKASIYTPFSELSLSSTDNNSPFKKAYTRSNSLSAKHKKKLLPPLANTISESSGCGVDDLNTSKNNFDYIINENIFPNTENKKRPLQKIQTNHNNNNNNKFAFNYSKNNFQDNNNTVTIDILSESGRYSRQSLEPIHYLETSRSKYSSRPTSVKEPLFHRMNSSDKINYTLNKVKDEINLHIASIHDSKDEELVEPSSAVATEKEEVKNDFVDEFISNVESYREINEKSENNLETIKKDSKPPEVIPRSSLQVNKLQNNKQSNNLKSAANNRIVTNKIIKKQSISNEKNLKTNQEMKINNSTKCNAKSFTCNNNKSTLNVLKNPNPIKGRKLVGPLLNIDLFIPTSNRASSTTSISTNKINIKQPLKQPQTEITQPIDDKQTTITKNPSINSPTQIETSRINKKVSLTSTDNQQQQQKQTIESTTTDYIDEIQSMTDVNITNRSNISSATGSIVPTSNRSSRFENNNSNMTSSNIGEPSQPVIALMFEDLPQPFTSKISSSQNVDDLNKFNKKKKQKTIVYTKKSATNNNLKTNRTTSANTNILKSKPPLTTNNNTKLENKPNIEIQIKNEISSYIDSDLNSNRNLNDYDYFSDNDNSKLNVSSFNKSMSESQTQIDMNEYSIKLKSDLVKSVAEKVEAIYNKYNELIHRQENIMLDSKKSFQEQAKELNEQKSHFSEEMAQELENNINFDAVSSDPELIKRLKQVYAQVKENLTKQEEESEELDEPKRKELEPVLEVNSLSSTTSTVKFPSENNTLIKRNNSIRSNVDIREVFSIVNNGGVMSKHSSINTKNDLEMTFPPSTNYNKSKVILTASKNIYQIPTNLSDKINTLVTTFQNNSENNVNDKKEEEEKVEENNLDNEKFSKLNDTFDRKLKFNYLNSLDSIGNESNNSIASDSNSISYHYDVKYRNDSSKSPVNLLFENENDFQFKWKRGNLIGKGAFGSVYQAMLSTGAIIAVKQIEMEESDLNKARKEYDNVREEVKILRELDHINIVQFMGTMLEDKTVNIFMELIPGGTIEFLLKTYGPFEESLFKNFTHQILEGINYIHSRNVVHRDIKGKNIMLMGNGIIKLIDFGCAKRLKKNQSSNSIKQLLKSLKGTPYWMSPEVIREVGHGSKADIWSIGATVFEMSTGQPPWSEYQPIAAIYRIGSGDTPIPELPDKFSTEAKEFVSKCLIRNPDDRPSAADLLLHGFIKQNI